VEDGAVVEDPGVDELDLAGAVGAKQGFAIALDASRVTSSIRFAPSTTTVGDQAAVSTGWEATTYLVIALTWSAKRSPPRVGQAWAMPS
jgi:hypothetical protein